MNELINNTTAMIHNNNEARWSRPYNAVGETHGNATLYEERLLMLEYVFVVVCLFIYFCDILLFVVIIFLLFIVFLYGCFIVGNLRISYRCCPLFDGLLLL